MPDVQNFAPIGRRTLELDEIRGFLRRFGHEPKYRGYGERVSIHGIAKLIGTSRAFLYALMNDDVRFTPSAHMRKRLTFMVHLVDQYGLRWRIRDRKWTPLMPDGKAPYIPPDMQSRPRNERVDHLGAL